MLVLAEDSVIAAARVEDLLPFAVSVDVVRSPTRADEHHDRVRVVAIQGSAISDEGVRVPVHDHEDVRSNDRVAREIFPAHIIPEVAAQKVCW